MRFLVPPRCRWLPAMLVAASLVTVRAATPPAADEANDEAVVTTETVVKKATPRFIETLLERLGYDYQRGGENGYAVKLDGANLEGVRMLVFIQTGGGLMLYCGFHGAKADARKMNEWNKKHRFSRAYLDDSGNAVLESDLDFDGGVTLESLQIFVKVFKASVGEYKKFLSS